MLHIFWKRWINRDVVPPRAVNRYPVQSVLKKLSQKWLTGSLGFVSHLQQWQKNRCCGAAAASAIFTVKRCAWRLCALISPRRWSTAVQEGSVPSCQRNCSWWNLCLKYPIVSSNSEQATVLMLSDLQDLHFKRNAVQNLSFVKLVTD